MTIYTYLGPESTFTEAALLSVPDAATAPPENRIPSLTIPDALEKVICGVADAAMIPIENSVEGSVSATLDAIAGLGYSDGMTLNDSPAELRIIKETLVPISFTLGARSYLSPQDIATISTHAHAWAQCRGWIHKHAPHAAFIAASSTAAAAEESTRSQRQKHAVVCSPAAAKKYKLKIVADNIQDNHNAVTRFILVTTRDSRLPGKIKFPTPTGADKTTLAIPLPNDRPGELMAILDQFAVHGVNLSRIESRPTGKELGKYSFSIDIEGHIDEARIQHTLCGLYRISPQLRFLGSYQRADCRENVIASHTDDRHFRQAQKWLESLEY